MTRRRWWQSAGETRSLDVASIASIDLETRRGQKQDTRRVVIRMNDGEAVPLFAVSTSGAGPARRRDQLEALLKQAPAYQSGLKSDQ